MNKCGKKNIRKSGDGNMKITSVFKVKKCLFTSCSDFKSPTLEPKMSPLCRKITDSPDMMVTSEDSPFSLFTSRKRRMETSPMVRRTTPMKMDCSTPLRRTQSLRKFMELTPDNPVKVAVQKSIQNPDLIGDFSKPCVLPTIEGKHPDLKTISPETVAVLIQEKGFSNFTIVDCRYPYEFEGGHIKNAQNIYYKGSAEERFFSSKENVNSSSIFIFYCEFSSERAPGMIRFLRSKDRELNKDRYPHLYYPELYVIEGGYKAFYSSFQDLCEPREYKTMLDKDCSEQMSFYRNQCKKFKPKSKRRLRSKTLEIGQS